MVWQDKDVGHYVDKQFVPLRVTPLEKKKYDKFRSDFNVRGTPTVLLLSSVGEEIDRICGFNRKKEEYFQTLLDYASGKNTLMNLLTKYQSNPDDVELNFKLGKKHNGRWEGKKAYPYFSAVMKLDPDDKRGFKTESKYNVVIYEAQEKKNVEPLLEFIASTTDEKFLYGGYSTLAFFYAGEKDTDKAIATYEEALKKMPENTSLMNRYAMFILRKKIEDRYEKAKEMSKKAIATDPDEAYRGYNNLILYYRHKKDPENVMKTYEEAVAKVPDNSSLMSGYARAILDYKIKDQYDKGIEILKKALTIDPKAAHIWTILARFHFEKGHPEKAAEAMKTALTIIPVNKDYQKLLEKYEKAISKIP